MDQQTTSPATSGIAVDPSAMRIAAVYAKGLLGATEASGQTETLVEELDSLVVDVLDKLPNLEALLSSAMVSAEEHQHLIERALGGQASPILLNFLKVLAAHMRLSILREIRTAVHAQFDEMRGRIRVLVSTATPIDDRLAAQITHTVQAALGGQPVLERKTNPSLIGGLVLRIGDTVYDASVSTQLKQMRTQMINRSIHEIQSRRDRFGHSEGN